MISFEDFVKLELKIGIIEEINIHPNADKLYLLKVNIGSEIRELVAGIRDYYPDPEILKGKRVVVLANLEPKTIRGVVSHGMMLAVKDESNLSVVTVEKDISPGSRVT